MHHKYTSTWTLLLSGFRRRHRRVGHAERGLLQGLDSHHAAPQGQCVRRSLNPRSQSLISDPLQSSIDRKTITKPVLDRQIQ